METPLQYSCLENPMDGEAWWAAVHGVTKSWTWLSDLTFTFHFHALEKEMATHSRILAWRIPGTEEPGGLPSLGSHRIGHDWSKLAAAMGPNAMTFLYWVLHFKPGFSLFSFTFKSLFSSSLLSAISLVSSAYLTLLIFLSAILIPSCESFSLAFCMMYSAYKLNNQVDNT